MLWLMRMIGSPRRGQAQGSRIVAARGRPDARNPAAALVQHRQPAPRPFFGLAPEPPSGICRRQGRSMTGKTNAPRGFAVHGTRPVLNRRKIEKSTGWPLIARAPKWQDSAPRPLINNQSKSNAAGERSAGYQLDARREKPERAQTKAAPKARMASGGTIAVTAPDCASLQ